MLRCIFWRLGVSQKKRRHFEEERKLESPCQRGGIKETFKLGYSIGTLIFRTKAIRYSRFVEDVPRKRSSTDARLQSRIPLLPRTAIPLVRGRFVTMTLMLWRDFTSQKKAKTAFRNVIAVNLTSFRAARLTAKIVKMVHPQRPRLKSVLNGRATLVSQLM